MAHRPRLAPMQDGTMEEIYERQLAGIVEALPRGECVVALVPTIPLDQAAALASDVAQSIGAARGGHTILTSFEAAPARLDHEIGVEEGRGLTDVLSKRARIAEVAAHGKARRFIYVPAGSAAAPGASLLRSEEWRRLSGSAVQRGGTVLALVPPEVFVDAFVAAQDRPAERPRFDAIVWLGSDGQSGPEVREAASASAARDVGSLGLPGSTPTQPPGPAQKRGARKDLVVGTPTGRQLRARVRRRRFSQILWLILLGLAALAAAYFALWA